MVQETSNANIARVIFCEDVRSLEPASWMKKMIKKNNNLTKCVTFRNFLTRKNEDKYGNSVMMISTTNMTTRKTASEYMTDCVET